MQNKTFKDSFSVLQWNVLADTLCTQDSFPKVEQQCLNWNFREKLYQQIFPYIIADIICLEEVDHPDFFKDLLPKSYICHFLMKPNDHADGIFFAYNGEKFDQIQYKVEYYKVNGKESSQFFVAQLLKNKINHQEVWVLGTHLKAKKQFESDRVEQVKQIVNFFQDKGLIYQLI